MIFLAKYPLIEDIDFEVRFFFFFFCSLSAGSTSHISILTPSKSVLVMCKFSESKMSPICHVLAFGGGFFFFPQTGLLKEP